MHSEKLSVDRQHGYCLCVADYVKQRIIIITQDHNLGTWYINVCLFVWKLSLHYYPAQWKIFALN